MLLSLDTSSIRNVVGDEAALELLAQAGFGGADFSLFHAASRLLEGDYRANAARVRAAAERYGLKLRQAHAPFPCCYGEPSEVRAEKVSQLNRSIEFASLIGAEILVVHAVACPDPALRLEYNAEFYRQLLPTCERFGVKLGVENLFTVKDGRVCGDLFSGPQSWTRLIRTIDSPWAVGCVDLGHCNICGVRPPDFLRQAGRGLVQALHIHDNNGALDEHLIPHMGNVDWDDTVAALAEIGYSGDFSLELPVLLDRFPQEMLLPAARLAAASGALLIRKWDELTARPEPSK